MPLQKFALAMVLLTVLAGVAMTATPPGIPNGWTDGYVYANGIRIHYYHAVPAPGKPVIVMAHGATDYGLNWTTLTIELQTDYDQIPLARGNISMKKVLISESPPSAVAYASRCKPSPLN